MRSWQWAIAAIIGLAMVPWFVPQALAFPFERRLGPVAIWSETPIPPAIDAVIAHVDPSVAASPLSTAASGRHIILVNGGWRWLALTASPGLGLTRPLSEAVILNRSDVAADCVNNGVNGWQRSVSGVIAHKPTHAPIRARPGITRAGLLPLWVREGYPDCITCESSLSDRNAALPRRTKPTHPALTAYDGRRRVAAALGANAGSVDCMPRDTAP